MTLHQPITRTLYYHYTHLIGMVSLLELFDPCCFYTHLSREVLPLERFGYVIRGVRTHGGQLETDAVVHQDQLQVEVLDCVPHRSG